MNPEVMENKNETVNTETTVTPEDIGAAKIKTPEAPAKKESLISKIKNKLFNAFADENEKNIAKLQAEREAKKQAYMKETGKSEKEMYQDVRIQGQQEALANVKALGDTDRLKKLEAFYEENPTSAAHWDAEKREYYGGTVGQSNFSQDHH